MAFCKNCNIDLDNRALFCPECGTRIEQKETSISNMVRAKCKGISGPGYYVGDDIPPQRLLNARKSLNIPGGEEVFALFDCTVFGSAKEAIVIAGSGIYAKNTRDNDIKHIPFNELKNLRIVESKDSLTTRYVLLSNGIMIDASGLESKVEETLVPLINNIIKKLEASSGQLLTEPGTAESSKHSEAHPEETETVSPVSHSTESKTLTGPETKHHPSPDTATGRIAGSEDESLPEDNNLRVGLKEEDGDWHYYNKNEIETKLHNNIVGGKYNKTDKVEIHKKNKDGSWSKSYSTLEEFAIEHGKAGNLYKPIRTSAMEGLGFGLLIGAILKLIETFIGYLMVDVWAVILFLVVLFSIIYVLASWSKMSCLGLFVASGIIGYLFYYLGLGPMIMFVVSIVVSLLVGGILGLLPGMGIGGIVGLVRRGSLPKAPDAEPESSMTLIGYTLIPLILGGALLVFYFLVFNPWLISRLQPY